MQEKKKFIYSVIGLFVITILFWTIWIVRAYAWVEYQELKVTILGVLLIGIGTGMLVAAYMVFRIARTSYMLLNQKRKMIIAMMSMIAVMCINFYMLYEMRNYGYTISTLAAIERKESEGGNYFFQIRDSSDDTIVMLQCNKETYDALQVDEMKRYSIQYRKLNFADERAILGFIDMKYIME